MNREVLISQVHTVPRELVFPGNGTKSNEGNARAQAYKSVSVKALSGLDPIEVKELVASEAIIAKGWETFVDVGRALTVIRNKRLYRADYETFEAYCRQKWQYGRSHA